MSAKIAPTTAIFSSPFTNTRLVADHFSRLQREAMQNRPPIIFPGHFDPSTHPGVWKKGKDGALWHCDQQGLVIRHDLLSGAQQLYDNANRLFVRPKSTDAWSPRGNPEPYRSSHLGRQLMEENTTNK